MKRRDFITNSSIAGLGVLSTSGVLPSLVHETTRVTILHTNDMHSRVEPFPKDAARNAGMGGVARRSALIDRVRKAEDHVLLFDCGDIFQGTPYFNFFGGELEFKLMSKMKYDAATMGNHDFDGGIDGFQKQMPHADFPFLISNYDFSNTVLEGRTQKFKIFQAGNIKIGVFGLGIELNGLVPQTLYKETVYLDPISVGNQMAKDLKDREGCDFVICLSHLGYKYRNSKVSDVQLAKQSANIDVILGGHTHTFMYEPDIVLNKNQEEVVINQAGWAGIMLGRLDIYFEKNKKGRCQGCKNTFVA